MMKINRLPLFALAFASAALPLGAATVRFEWDPSVAGSYQVFSQGEKPVPRTESFSADFPDGKFRVTAPGVDGSFEVRDGKVRWEQGSNVERARALVFDPAGPVFRFKMAKFRLRVEDCDLPLSISGVLPPGGREAPGVKWLESGEWKIHAPVGYHTLITSAGRQRFLVGEDGVIRVEGVSDAIRADGDRLIVRGKAYEIQPAEGTENWTLRGLKTASGPQTLQLLPNLDQPYSFSVAGNPQPLEFWIDPRGFLGRTKEGPFEEILEFKDAADVSALQIGLPGGTARREARLSEEAAQSALRTRLWEATGQAEWKQDFVIEDAMKLVDFPEELLSFPVSLPPRKNRALHLLEFDEKRVREIPFQLSADGVEIHFRSSLNRGQQKTFRLIAEAPEGLAIPESPPIAATRSGDSEELVSDRLRVRIPAGSRNFPGGKLLREVPAPIEALSQAESGKPAMRGSFASAEDWNVLSLETRTLADGPLFAEREVIYRLDGNREYRVRLRIERGEPVIKVAETLSGFPYAKGESARAALRLDFGSGLADPNQRQVAAMGYGRYSGDYGKGADPSGRLDFELGIYTPNQLGVMRAATLSNPKADDALLFATYRLRDWELGQRYVWSSRNAPENLRFYSTPDGGKFMTAGLVGEKRFWAVGVIPQKENLLLSRDLPGPKQPSVGPEIRLAQKLQDYSLDRVRKLNVDFPEDLDPAPFAFAKEMTYDEWMDAMITGNTFTSRAVAGMLGTYWDYSNECGPVACRNNPKMLFTYARSRGKWTPEQRRGVRAFLVFLASVCEDDNLLPHHSMLGGHPNFIMDVKAAVGAASGVFRQSPDAPAWKESYTKFLDEWFDAYLRKPGSETNTLGGRWTENIACYTGQCLVGYSEGATGVRIMDGTDLYARPDFQALMRWMLNATLSPNDGVRMIPPQGAHARAFEPGGRFYELLPEIADEMAASAPELSAQWKWILSNGKTGENPRLRSVLFTDYGPVLRHDFGGPRESYAHLQNIHRGGYRWTGAGILYYGAKNRVWSYNNKEDNGDNFSIGNLAAFNVKGKGLATTPTDQLLYDFGFVQYYRQPGRAEGHGANPDYLARAILMADDEYLVVSDEVKDLNTPGTFSWGTVFDFPQIQQLKPGATPKERRSVEDARNETPRTTQIREYSGLGDFLTVVSPETVKAVKTSYGVQVNADHILISPKRELDFKEGELSFQGRAGFARDHALAIFDGKRIALNRFELSKNDADFGISAEWKEGRVTGRVVGRQGGHVEIQPPTFVDLSRARVVFGGREIPAQSKNGRLGFDFAITQKEGVIDYSVTF